MIDITECQRQIILNKEQKKFITGNVKYELDRAVEEIDEAREAFMLQNGEFGEEVADAIIFLLAAAHYEGVDIEREILDKIEKNKGRQYDV